MQSLGGSSGSPTLELSPIAPKRGLDISAEGNVYYYKLAPGHQTEVFAPVNLELLRQMRKIMKNQDLLSEEDEQRMSELEAKLENLLRGGYVGSPKRRINF